MKKKKNKRFLAVLVALLVLLPTLLLAVSAYPAEEYFPENAHYTLSDYTLPQVFKTIDELTLSSVHPGSPVDVVYTDVIGLFNEETPPYWKYISFQVSIADINGVEYGHFTCGFYTTFGNSATRMRIGYYYDLGDGQGVQQDYPVDVSSDLVVTDTCVGFRVTCVDDVNKVYALEIQYYGKTDYMTTVRTQSFILPSQANKLYYSVKTEYASADFGVLDTRTTFPHMPNDLEAYADITSDAYNGGYNAGYETGNDEGYNDGFNDAAYQSQHTFDNMGRLIWTVIDMPFVLVSQVLNFDLFGVNVSNVVFSLVTVGLCVWILHKVGIL